MTEPQLDSQCTDLAVKHNGEIKSN